MVTVKRSQELVELAEQARRAAEAGDDSFTAETTAHGEVVVLGSAPDEAHIGRDAVLAFTIERGKQLNEAAGLSADFDPETEVQAWEAGSTGWRVTQSSWRLADGTTIPNRTIQVFAKDDDGSWKAVFVAASVLVPNEALSLDSPAVAVLGGRA
jgi:hypothetical protein